jgi:hypothetical protein
MDLEFGFGEQRLMVNLCGGGEEGSKCKAFVVLNKRQKIVYQSVYPCEVKLLFTSPRPRPEYGVVR